MAEVPMSTFTVGGAEVTVHLAALTAPGWNVTVGAGVVMAAELMVALITCA